MLGKTLFLVYPGPGPGMPKYVSGIDRPPFKACGGTPGTPPRGPPKPGDETCVGDLALGAAPGGGSRGYPPVPVTNGRALNGGRKGGHACDPQGGLRTDPQRVHAPTPVGVTGVLLLLMYIHTRVDRAEVVPEQGRLAFQMLVHSTW